MADKSVRDEIAELTEAVRELRDREVAGELRSLRAEVEKLRAERLTHQCTCAHVHYPNTWTGTVTYPNYTVTSGTSTVTTTSGYMSGGNSTTLSLGN